MKIRTLKRIRGILEAPKSVTLEDLLAVARDLGFEVQEKKKGYMIIERRGFAQLIHRPHPGKILPPAAVEHFIREARLRERLIMDVKESKNGG